MTRMLRAALLALPLAACVSTPRAPVAPPAPVEVQILAINDFHGNLEPPRIAIDAVAADGTAVKVPAGGVAYLASAARALREGRPYTVTVSAGDMIGAAPLTSSLFLDEPAIEAMEEVGVEYNAVGNHEFDKGAAELLRMQRGGCAQHGPRKACAVEPFDGADFAFLAANVVTREGKTLFPGTAIKDFGPVQVGFIGMTLKETATLVSPTGVEGLTFADEAATANAAVGALEAAGADAIVVLIHQGGTTKGGYNDKSCPALDGDILPIIARLDPRIDAVVSGHTHQAYVCEVARPGARPLLLTSAGRYGTLITDIRLTFAPDRSLAGHRADNVVVQGEPFSGSAGTIGLSPAFPVYPKHARAAAIVERYVEAARPMTSRVVGRLSGPLSRTPTADREVPGGNFIADAQLAATRHLGAEIAFSNAGGVRAEIVPGEGGVVTFGQLFAMQPFGNNIVTLTLSGAELKSLLEQQFASGLNTAERPMMLLPSKGFAFAYDLKRPAGQRIVLATLNGKPIDPARDYRITVVHFLASGGDNFTVLKQGRDLKDSGLIDVEASEAYLKTGGDVPDLGRIKDLTPKP